MISFRETVTIASRLSSSDGGVYRCRAAATHANGQCQTQYSNERIVNSELSILLVTHSQSPSLSERVLTCNINRAVIVQLFLFSMQNIVQLHLLLHRFHQTLSIFWKDSHFKLLVRLLATQNQLMKLVKAHVYVIVDTVLSNDNLKSKCQDSRENNE
jgi:hypothetical protein